MDNFKNLFQKDNFGELSLTILFIIYLIMGYKLPYEVSKLISTPIGKIGVILIVIYISFLFFMKRIKYNTMIYG